jgi:hypothetical protein
MSIKEVLELKFPSLSPAEQLARLKAIQGGLIPLKHLAGKPDSGMDEKYHDHLCAAIGHIEAAVRGLIINEFHKGNLVFRKPRPEKDQKKELANG